MRVRGEFMELLLSFHYVGSRSETQAVQLRGRHLYPWSHLAGPGVAF